MTGFSEFDLADAALEWLHGPGRSIGDGLDIPPGAPGAELGGCGQIELKRPFRTRGRSGQSRLCTT